MSYNVANFDQTIHSEGIQGTVQLSDGNLGLHGSNGVTINSLGDITANAFFGYTSGGGGGGGSTPTLQQVTIEGATTNRAITISNSLSVTGNLFVSGNLVSVDTENLVVQDPIIQLANNSTSDTSNVGIIFTRPTSNIVIGYRGDEDEVMVGFSTSSASGIELNPLDDNKLNLKVYGNVEATNFIKGDATHMTNLTDASTGTFGSTIQTSVVTVNTAGRITGITAANINFPTETLQDLDSVLSEGKITTQNITVGKVTSTKENGFIGDGELLSNIVNSDVGPAVYGNTTHVAQITVTDTGRISAISNIEIQELSNLDQVVNRGNVTSNSITVDGIAVTSLTTSQGIVFCTPTTNTLSTSSDIIFDSSLGIMTVDGGFGGIVSRDLQYVKFSENVVVGTPVYLSDVEGNHLIASISDNTDTSKMPVAGLCLQSYSANDFGYIVRSGETLNISRSGLFIGSTPGDNSVVYIGAGGKLTIDRPSGATDLIQNIGIVSKVSGDNINVLIQGAGRTNDTPNRITAVNANIFQTVTIGGGPINLSTNLYVTGNVYADIYEGNANLLSNIVNSDVGPAAYGNTTHVTQITVTDTGRISAISNIEIQEQSTLDQVVNRGNVTSSTVQFTNTETSLITSGNVYINGANPYASLNVRNPTTSNVIYVQSQTTSNALISFVNTQTFVESGNEYPSLGCSGNDLVFYPGVPRDLAVTISADKNMTVVGNVEVHGLYLGNANLLSNIVNSDVEPATYGNTTHVTQITISDTGRITAVSNVEIQELSNLEQVVNRGNVTSNSIQVSGIVATGQANVANIYISQPVGADPTVSSNIIIIDQSGHSYKFFRVPAYPTGSLEGITIQNTTDGCQTLVDIYPIGGDLDVFENFSNGGTGPTVLTSLDSNLIINTGNHVMISCVTDLSNTFVNIIGFY